ncbi:MAG: SDR family oxidoreductase [Bradyrhizobiaceae bacterium]|nr:MAG: SDR family oxidoreductase [Bradyrhizobiaceae bacterium]
MDLNLKDRVALVTGGGAGLGEAIARSLAAENCKLWILDRNAGAAAGVAASIGNGTKSYAIDIGDAAAVTDAFAAIAAQGRIDILVNAAGVLSTGFVADLPVNEWQRVSQVNLAGMLHCIKAALPTMKQQHYGRIINIASISAARGGGSVGNTIYGATKAAVVAMTMGLARELGPEGITVNAISPAIVDTAMTHELLSEDARLKILTRIPLGRMAIPSDISNLAVFMASDRASFITGIAVPVDGGILTT